MASIRLTGDIRSLNSKLRRLAGADLEGINETIAQGLRTSTLQRFKTSTGPDGRRWKSSIRALETRGRTLVQTARLRNSIRTKADAESLAVGTNVVYAARHQLGDKRPVVIRAKNAKALRFQVGGRWVSKKQVRVQLPARPFLGISKTDLGEIKETLEKAVWEDGG